MKILSKLKISSYVASLRYWRPSSRYELLVFKDILCYFCNWWHLAILWKCWIAWDVAKLNLTPHVTHRRESVEKCTLEPWKLWISNMEHCSQFLKDFNLRLTCRIILQSVKRRTADKDKITNKLLRSLHWYMKFHLIRACTLVLFVYWM